MKHDTALFIPAKSMNAAVLEGLKSVGIIAYEA
jgi:hypothetical protein